MAVERRGRKSLPLGIAEIADFPGGMDALTNRVHDLRASGMDFAADCIEREIADWRRRRATSSPWIEPLSSAS